MTWRNISIYCPLDGKMHAPLQCKNCKYCVEFQEDRIDCQHKTEPTLLPNAQSSDTPKREDKNNWKRLRDYLIFSSNDSGANENDALIYGLIVGWGEESFEELKKKYDWGDGTITSLKALNNLIKSLEDGSALTVSYHKDIVEERACNNCGLDKICSFIDEYNYKNAKGDFHFECPLVTDIKKEETK